MINSKLIVVLGMHRSGTSAIARGLEVLGVNLGENLYPAAIDNPKGFWEDRDFLNINEEILGAINFTYDQLGLVNIQDLPEFEAISLKAENLVRHKCDQNILWGFKDPRTARLLPFWHAVFERVGCDIGYIIVTRNPISIVESLSNRSGFDSVKTFYLLLEHLVPAITKTKGTNRVVVDYDKWIENPSSELLRVAMVLKLPEPESAALKVYEREFLEKGLRHTVFTKSDLYNYVAVPKQVLACYDLLMDLANDNIEIDSKELDQAFDNLYLDMVSLSLILSYVGCQESKLNLIKQELAVQEQSILSLQARLEDQLTGNAWLCSQRDELEKVVEERESSIATLQMQLEDQLTGNAWLCSQRDAWEKIAFTYENPSKDIICQSNHVDRKSPTSKD
jgi:hypothetical protein